MSAHQSVNGVEVVNGYEQVRCECGWWSGPVPGVETALDAAMDHAYYEGQEDGIRGASR